jgi:hypothetical protein
MAAIGLITIALCPVAIGQEAQQPQQPQEAQQSQATHGPTKRLTRADVQALFPDAHIATQDELLEIMPGAHLDIVFGDTSLISWTNGDSGQLESVLYRSSPDWRVPWRAARAGSWRISKDGRYCGKVGYKFYTWPTFFGWCRFYVHKSDGTWILRASERDYPNWTVRLTPKDHELAR